MDKLFDELKARFRKIETRIMLKRASAKKLYHDQIKSLHQKFKVKAVKEKYSKGLNNHRQALLDQLKINLCSRLLN